MERNQIIGANFSFQHHSFRWTAENLRALGFDRMELWGIAPHLDLFHDSCGRLAEVKSILGDNGLTVRCFTPEQVLYPVNIASGDGAYRQASVERFMRAADLCAELGAPYLFLTPGRGFECESRETAWAHSVESVNRITAHARSLGVCCLLEPLQRVESNIVNTASELQTFWRSLDGDDIDVVLDVVAMATAGDSIAEYFEHFGARIAHVHIADGTPAGHFAWGDGNLPLHDHIAALRAHGFAGTLTFELFGNGSYAVDPVSAWRRCLAAITPLLHQADEA